MGIYAMGGDAKHLQVKYIIARFNFEKEKLNEAQQMLLLNDWIERCTKLEYYEMSQALLTIKRHMIRSMAEKKPKRTFWETASLRIKILIRKWRT